MGDIMNEIIGAVKEIEPDDIERGVGLVCDKVGEVLTEIESVLDEILEMMSEDDGIDSAREKIKDLYYKI